ncbi:MAG: MBL fold metallo-hydrolase [Hoeflea sp.]|uniref:MBL fold metallo-hydrolase n=1 Tax=Hoeflea sp. TaxID=1940281 RepID=UPI003EF2BBB4
MKKILDTDSFVALLGTKGGPAIRTGSTNPTSSLLVLGGRKIVVDCGLGVTRGLVDQGMALKDLGLIFITHMHSDHYLELGPLIHTAWTAGLATPVTVHAPNGIEEYWKHFLLSMKADIELRIEDEGRPDLSALVIFETLNEDEALRLDDLTVTATRNEHPPLVDTFALRFAGNGFDVVFSGDTAYLPMLADFAEGADLLIHEAMLEDALEELFKRVGNGDDRLKTHLLRSHTMARDAGKIATQARVGALALHHLIPSDDPNFTENDWVAAMNGHWDGPLHVGKDGMRIPLTRAS